ncbi:hypothetical protein [Kitasatospora sp. NPDC017646]|uniref:hypothetical protein n=1 Tax=Kitasatospora sp. NPDC017646 TaxID=3364024 RepID=UPI0037ADB3A3
MIIPLPLRSRLRAAGLGAGPGQVLGDQVREFGQAPADLDHRPHRRDCPALMVGLG